MRRRASRLFIHSDPKIPYLKGTAVIRSKDEEAGTLYFFGGALVYDIACVHRALLSPSSLERLLGGFQSCARPVR